VNSTPVRPRFALFVLVLLLFPFALPDAKARQSSPAQLKYRITALPELPGRPLARSFASAINERGQIVGTVFISDSASIAVLWENGTAIDLGSFGGPLSFAWDITEDGRIVGSSELPADIRGSVVEHAFRWQNGVLTDLGALPGCGSTAASINTAGEIVGSSTESSECAAGLLWTGGTIRKLGGVHPRIFTPVSIEDSGVIVGAVGLHGGDPTAALRQDGVFTLLSEPENAISVARDMNADGTVAGIFFTGEGQHSHAAIWVDGVLTDLGIPDGFWHSDVFAINNLGQVVGNTRPQGIAGEPPQDPHGMLWWNGETIDLTEALINGQGWEIELLSDINDQGQIVGIGRFNNEQRAILLTPETL
jgi:probable HAF family extracellular repeat protein